MMIVGVIFVRTLCRADSEGRQRDVYDFIKLDRNEAVIEIELKGSPNNLVIRRELSRKTRTSTYRINGKVVRWRPLLLVLLSPGR